MSKDIVLEEKEGWRCRECESVVQVNPMGLVCGCDDPAIDILDIPSKWVVASVKASLTSPGSISISDEDAQVFMKSILARDKICEHRCGFSWCPHLNAECDEGKNLSDNDGKLFLTALELIKKYVPSSEANDTKR